MRLLLLIVFLMAAVTFAHSQATDSVSRKIDFQPKLDGTLKTKVEYDTENEKMRFEVRNARFGTRGSLNPYISYRAEVDLSDEGRIRMLDAYVKVTPLQNLEFYLGQRKIPFGTDYLRSPAENMFANRSFVAKYVNDGLRDIGLVAGYSFGKKIPFSIWFAAMNGTGNNNPQWISRPNLAARLTLWPVKHFRIAGNYYGGATLTEKEIRMFGGELRYENKNLLLETEIMTRNSTDTLEKKVNSQGAYVHALYRIDTRMKAIRYISPVMRWDYMGRENFSIKNAERITAGINFGFEPKLFAAEIRLNYEKYLKSYFSTHFDKFVIEFVAKF